MVRIHRLSALIADGLSASTSAVRNELFGGLLVFDSFTAFLDSFWLASPYVVLTKLSGIPDREDELTSTHSFWEVPWNVPHGVGQ